MLLPCISTQRSYVRRTDVSTVSKVLESPDRQYSAISGLDTLQFTVTHALGFSVFTSRILATDLQQYHCNLKSHTKSSIHSLIPLLTLFCNCQLSSIPLLSGSYPCRLASRNSTHFFSTELFFITTLHGPRRKHSHFIFKGVVITPLHSNGSYSIVACVFVAAGICLPSRSLAMDVYSNFALQVFGRYVTVYLLVVSYGLFNFSSFFHGSPSVFPFDTKLIMK
jgi:hypothetical protein